MKKRKGWEKGGITRGKRRPLITREFVSESVKKESWRNIEVERNRARQIKIERVGQREVIKREIRTMRLNNRMKNWPDEEGKAKGKISK